MDGITAGIGIVFAGAFFAAAARLWNGKPAVLSPRIFTTIMGLAFLPLLAVCGFGVFHVIREGDLRVLIPFVLPLVLLATLLLFFRRIIGSAVVFNVDEESLYDALEASLDRHGLDYEETRSRIEVQGRTATIAVNYQATTNSGTVSARGDDRDDLKPVLEDLREHLRGKHLDKRSPIAYWYLVFGILMLAMWLTLAALTGTQ